MEDAVTGQQEKPNLEVLLSELVAELKRPLDPQVLSLFSRCGDQICCQSPSLVRAYHQLLHVKIPIPLASEDRDEPGG